MDHCLREIQLANMLGYTEMEDFRRARSRGEILEPARYLGNNRKKPVWIREDVETWMGVMRDRKDKADFLALVNKVA